MAPPAAPTGGRIHEVQPGESLWSIAVHELGRGASRAELAAFVARIWAVNAATTPSGNPDLIAVGARLRIPDPTPGG